MKFVQIIFISLFVFLITLSFLNSPGASDVDIWKQWANNTDRLGIVAGYAANEGDYPPLSTVILFSAFAIRTYAGIKLFYAIKLSIILFLILTSSIFYLWTRDIATTLVLHLALLLNSAALGYIDIYFAPALLLSLWALKQGKLTLFAVSFSIACLTKWQPLIIVPFIFLYVLNLNTAEDWKKIDIRRLLRNFAVPTITIVVLTLSVFGVTPVWKAFEAATGHEFLSGFALNFNWLLTHALNVLYPGRFGGLVDGETQIIATTDLKVTLVPRLLFILAYICTVASFFKCDKTFENLILFSLVGYLAYFTFNTGVHENHLFLAAILSLVLFWVNKDHLSTMIIVLLMYSVNLFVFDGFSGEMQFSRVILNTVDITVFLALFNVTFFSYLWWTNALVKKETDAGQTLRTSGRAKDS